MDLEQDAMPKMSQMASHHSFGLAYRPEDFVFHIRKQKGI